MSLPLTVVLYRFRRSAEDIKVACTFEMGQRQAEVAGQILGHSLQDIRSSVQRVSRGGKSSKEGEDDRCVGGLSWLRQSAAAA